MTKRQWKSVITDMFGSTLNCPEDCLMLQCSTLSVQYKRAKECAIQWITKVICWSTVTSPKVTEPGKEEVENWCSRRRRLSQFSGIAEVFRWWTGPSPKVTDSRRFNVGSNRWSCAYAMDRWMCSATPTLTA